MNYIGLIIPLKNDRERAVCSITTCIDDKCKTSMLDKNTRNVYIKSKKGLSIDINDPHVMKFAFKGDVIKKRIKNGFVYNIGDPVQNEMNGNGEFVSDFSAKEVELNNLPLRDTFLFDAFAENINNHWYFHNMMDDIHEINIPAKFIKEVNLNLNHPMLTTATVKLDRKRSCKVTADHEWINERRKLYCQ